MFEHLLEAPGADALGPADAGAEGDADVAEADAADLGFRLTAEAETAAAMVFAAAQRLLPGAA